MKNIPFNPRDTSQEPEYTYCCGTVCDKEKVAWEFEQTRAELLTADKLIGELLDKLAVLETTNAALATQSALNYKWYLDECNRSEKLRVELEVIKRDKPA